MLMKRKQLDFQEVLKLQHILTLWIPFLLTGVVAAAYITSHCLLYFELNPTVTYVNSFRHPVAEVPFPGISICSVNKISKRAVEEYARNITKMTKGLDEKDLIKRFELIGGLFDSTGFDIDDAYNLQVLLDTVFSTKPGFFDVYQFLKKLAPKCEELLLKCSWAGKIYPCNELFELRVSPEGFCCMFNYNRVGRKIMPVQVRHLNVIGTDMGLKVLLNSSVNDYFYSQRSTIGFIIQIFNSVFYPDILTGELSEFPLSPNSDMLVPLQINIINSDDEIRKYKIGQRLCYFADEQPRGYGIQYSQPECLLKCKLQNIQAVCNCIPFYTPRDFLDPPVSYCNLGHLECLSKYKVTWTSYRPTEETPDSLNEMEYALTCGACNPLCNLVEYEYQLDRSDLDPENNMFELDEFLFNETHLEESSLIRIYHPSPFCSQYKKQLIYSTNGLLANIGGILGVSIGCSLMSSIEIGYYATIKFYKYWKRSRETRSIGSLSNRL
ncbi:pickpocket protein 28-like isoform X2 [Episyrphus balteatus]|uniref:pickpocket protein 28-like isoform X2 n=1 Tax=Episyrphus balteatus TaxID=286459 RepID=UPI002486B10D|nr:pickpocket protein 28-like isoform X2 [Episyrphus balteatus]